MTRLQVVNMPFFVIFYSAFNHVGHDRDNHSRKNNDANYINQRNHKNSTFTSKVVIVEIAKSITIYQKIKRKDPFVYFIYSTIFLPITSKA